MIQEELEGLSDNALRLMIAMEKGWRDVRYDGIRNEVVGTPHNVDPRIFFVVNKTVPNWPADIQDALMLWDELPDAKRIHHDGDYAVFCGALSYGPSSDIQEGWEVREQERLARAIAILWLVCKHEPQHGPFS